MEFARSSAALLVAIAILLQPFTVRVAFAAQASVTETLLEQPQGIAAPGRLWPGFAAAQGLDTGAQADPSGPKPQQIDTGATADPTGAPPVIIPSNLSPGGVVSGGDLTGPTVPWTGSGAPAPTTLTPNPLTGGTPTSGGTPTTGGTPQGGGLSGLGGQAAGLLGQTAGMPGMGGLGALAGLGMLGAIPGMGGSLGDIMGIIGMLSILSALPQILQQLPQMIQQLFQSIAQMILSIFQLPQMLWQSFSNLGQGFMGLGGQLGQTGQTGQQSQQPIGVQDVPNGVAGGVAGSMPQDPLPSGPGAPSGQVEQAPDGYYLSRTGSAAICFDGGGYYPPGDTHSPGTAYQINGQYLNGDVTPYVVVNLADYENVPMGTRVYVHNHSTGLGTWAIAGDRGPDQSRAEISVATANAIGANIHRDSSGNMMNAVDGHTLSFYFYR